MANHITQSQIQTLLAITTTNLTPTQFFQLADALNRIKYTLAGDGAAGAGESSLGTIFASTNPNP
jgi:hypothetical protein